MLRSSLVLASVLLCSPAVASAQPSDRPSLLGERALGMGGAMVASTRGPGAAYYNPAGLNATGRTAIGGSLSLRTFRSYGITDGYRSSVGIEDLDDTTLDTASVFLGGLVAFGDRLPDGMRRHAIAAGTLVARSRDLSFLDSAVDADLDRASALDVERRAADRWDYIAHPARPHPALSLGLTAAVSSRNERYSESITDGGGLGGGSTSARLSSRDVDISVDNLHLVLRAGVTVRVTEWLQAGLVFQGPGIPLSQSGRARFQRLSVDDPESTLFRRTLEDVDAALPAPWRARAGLYARVHPDFGLAFEGGMRGRVGSDNDPWLVLNEPVPLDEGRPAATYYPNERVSDFAFDASVGAELEAFDEVPIRAGLFYAQASERRIADSSQVYPEDAVSEVGSTLSVGFHDPSYDFTVGVSYAYGWGTGARPNPDAAGPAYLPTTIESNEIVVVLSGVTGAAAELALEAYHAMTGSEEAEEEPPELTDQQLLERLPLPPRQDAQ